MAQPGVTIKVPRTGRVQAPKLDNAQLTEIGRAMVDAQKKRWGEGIDADANTAKPLSRRYIFVKAFVRKTNRPKRDMRLTGETLANFQLRKAINGVIRAENSTRRTREKARGCQQYDQMIGLGPIDQLVIYRGVNAAYGKWVKDAWIKYNVR